MRLYELIVEGYKEAEQEFSIIDPNANQLINQYKALVNKNQVQGRFYGKKLDDATKEAIRHFGIPTDKIIYLMSR